VFADRNAYAREQNVEAHARNSGSNAFMVSPWTARMAVVPGSLAV